jgi:hypothetical protein
MNESSAHGSSAGALLELKLIGDIIGQFFVPRYQRGYRWGTLEVERLLDDIWDSNGVQESRRRGFGSGPVAVGQCELVYRLVLGRR